MPTNSKVATILWADNCDSGTFISRRLRPGMRTLQIRSCVFSGRPN